MLLYICSILGADALIILFNSLFALNVYSEITIWYIVFATLGLTVAVIIIDGLFAFLIRRLPEKWFSADKKRYDVGKKEVKFWKALGVRRWKDKVWEMGGFTDFSKREVKEPNSPDYINRFLLESNYGVVIHIVGIILGFAVIFILPLKFWFMFGLPVAIVNAVLNFLPLGALRFNIPRLKALLKFSAKKTANEKQKPLA